MENTNRMIGDFKAALLQINRMKAAEIFRYSFENGQSFRQLENIAICSLEEIGKGWEDGDISLSQVYMSGVICEEMVEKYLPKYDIQRKDVPQMAIGVLLDHHALGKRIVFSVLRAGGFEVLDFGQGVSVEEMVQKTVENKVDILLISTLMLSSALKVKEVVQMLRKSNANTKIIAGGAPFRLDTNLWREVGADADGKNASDVIGAVEMLWKGGK